jgi:hypothetical protein
MDSFDLYVLNTSNQYILKDPVRTYESKESAEYDINTETYTYTITKKYSFSSNNPNSIINYYICVKALANPYEEKEEGGEGQEAAEGEGQEEKKEEYNNIYLKNLSYQGEVDLTKIGSNIVELKEYRYWYEPALDTNEGLVTMTFFTEAYPDHFTEFTDFKI